MKLFLPVTVLLCAGLALVFGAKIEENVKDSQKPEVVKKSADESKAGVKRSLFGLGYGYSGYGSLGSGTLDYGTLGGYGLGSAISLPHYELPALSLPYSYPLHTTITKHISVPVPQPIAVPIEKHIPYPVAAPYPVEVPRPYAVEVPKPVTIPIEKPYPVPIDRPYPVAVPVYKHIGLSHDYPIYSKSISALPWPLSKSIW